MALPKVNCIYIICLIIFFNVYQVPTLHAQAKNSATATTEEPSRSKIPLMVAIIGALGAIIAGIAGVTKYNTYYHSNHTSGYYPNRISVVDTDYSDNTYPIPNNTNTNQQITNTNGQPHITLNGVPVKLPEESPNVHTNNYYFYFGNVTINNHKS